MTTKYTIIALLIVPFLLLSVIWISTPLIKLNLGLDHDGVYYASMANAEKTDLGEVWSHTAPWCWRVLTPFLASSLPFSTLMNFKTLAFFSNWLTLVLLYGILRESNLSYRSSILGVLFYAGVFWSIKFSFYSPCYIEFLTQTFAVAILFLMLLRKYWAIPILITIGVLQKESILFLAPVVFLHYANVQGWFTKKSIIYSIGLLLFPILTVVTVRTIIQPVNSYSSFTAFLENFGQALHPEFWPRFAAAIFSGLGVLPVIVLYKAKDSYQYLRENPHWLVLVIIGSFLLFGGRDKSRQFLFILPVAVVLGATLLEPILDNSSRRAWIWTVISLVLHFYLGNHFTPMGTYTEYKNRLVPVLAPDPYLGSLIRIGSVLIILISVTLYMNMARDKTTVVATKN